MGTQVKHRYSWTRLISVFVVVASLAFSAYAASAASLGGINSDQILTHYDSVSITPPTPTYVAFDTFAGCRNTLDGWVDDVGNVWVSHEGNWQCLGGDVARNKRRYSIGHASVDIGLTTGFSASTNIARISTQSGKSGPGLALFDDGTNFLSIVYKRDQDRLVLGATVPSGYREIAEVDPISDFDNAVMTVRVDQPNLTVLINGTVYMTVDLSDPAVLSSDEQLLLLGNTRFGLASDFDNWSRFSSFQVELLP